MDDDILNSDDDVFSNNSMGRPDSYGASQGPDYRNLI